MSHPYPEFKAHANTAPLYGQPSPSPERVYAGMSARTMTSGHGQSQRQRLAPIFLPSEHRSDMRLVELQKIERHLFVIRNLLIFIAIIVTAALLVIAAGGTIIDNHISDLGNTVVQKEQTQWLN